MSSFDSLLVSCRSSAIPPPLSWTHELKDSKSVSYFIVMNLSIIYNSSCLKEAMVLKFTITYWWRWTSVHQGWTSIEMDSGGIVYSKWRTGKWMMFQTLNTTGKQNKPGSNKLFVEEVLVHIFTVSLYLLQSFFHPWCFYIFFESLSWSSFLLDLHVQTPTFNHLCQTQSSSLAFVPRHFVTPVHPLPCITLTSPLSDLTRFPPPLFRLSWRRLPLPHLHLHQCPRPQTAVLESTCWRCAGAPHKPGHTQWDPTASVACQCTTQMKRPPRLCCPEPRRNQLELGCSEPTVTQTWWAQKAARRLLRPCTSWLWATVI